MAAVHAALLAVDARCDRAARRESDPIGFVHRYDAPLDREIVALIASSFAFGNVKALRAKIADCLDRLGPSPSAALDDAARVRRVLRGFKHRVYTEHHVAALLLGARAVQRASGSLGAALAAAYDQSSGDLVSALASWAGAIRAAGGLSRTAGNGAAHILPNPRGGGANKRLMLLLRWMVRPADGVDLGLWPLPPAALVIPLDVHIHKLGQNLGLTRTKTPSWRAALEITDGLRRFDPDDPTRFDFSLCHLGMVQRCPSRRDIRRCEGCGVKPVCRHWAEN